MIVFRIFFVTASHIKKIFWPLLAFCAWIQKGAPNNKILTIYIRSRVTVKNKMNKDYFLNDAKNCNSKDYAAVVKYFLNLNWKVILIGDEYLTLVSKIKKNVVDAKILKVEDL